MCKTPEAFRINLLGRRRFLKVSEGKARLWPRGSTRRHPWRGLRLSCSRHGAAGTQTVFCAPDGNGNLARPWRHEEQAIACRWGQGNAAHNTLAAAYSSVRCASDGDSRILAIRHGDGAVEWQNRHECGRRNAGGACQSLQVVAHSDWSTATRHAEARLQRTCLQQHPDLERCRPAESRAERRGELTIPWPEISCRGIFSQINILS